MKKILTAVIALSIILLMTAGVFAFWPFTGRAVDESKILTFKEGKTKAFIFGRDKYHVAFKQGSLIDIENKRIVFWAKNTRINVAKRFEMNLGETIYFDSSNILDETTDPIAVKLLRVTKCGLLRTPCAKVALNLIRTDSLFEFEKIEIATQNVVRTKTEIRSGTTYIDLLYADENGMIVGAGDGTADGHLRTSPNRELTYDEGDWGDRKADAYFVVSYTGTNPASWLVSIDCDRDDGCDFKDEVTGSTLASGKKNQTSFTIGDATLKVEYFEENYYVNLTAYPDTVFDRVYDTNGNYLILPPTSIDPVGEYPLKVYNSAGQVIDSYTANFLGGSDGGSGDGGSGGYGTISPRVSYQGVLDMLEECMIYQISIRDPDWNQAGYISGNSICGKVGKTCLAPSLRSIDFEKYSRVSCSYQHPTDLSSDNELTYLTVWCCSPP